MELIELIASDGVIVETEVKIVKCSIAIRTMLEEYDLNDSNDSYRLENMNSALLRRVLEWANHYKNDPIPIEVDNNNVLAFGRYEITSWDTEFLFNGDPDTLCDFIAAAHYLDIPHLMAVTCKMIANITNKYKPDEIRRAVWILNLIPMTDQLKAFKFVMRTNNFNWTKILVEY